MRAICFIRFVSALWIGLWLLSCCSRGNMRDELYWHVDSLNRFSYEMRYKDLDASARAADSACKLSGSYANLRSEALNNKGFCAFMYMDFEAASRLYRQASSASDNEIERLIADVGMMKICQRTSMNKEFYDYRNSALRRMKRIAEEAASITDAHDKQRLNYALSEFYIASGIYYYYLQQDKESMQAINSITESMLENDTAQRLYYEYMRGSGGMYEAATPDMVVKGEFGFLVDCYLKARSGGYIYFEANALQAMAELLNLKSNRILLEKERKGLLRLVNEKGLPTDSLPLFYANEALNLFKQYGDWYQISGAYRTIATYYNFENRPEKALPNLEKALNYVNLHHERRYHCNDTTDRLRTFVPAETKSVELKWITEEHILTVPEWITRLREQLSRTYAAMGCKFQSDYNRNIYLDLLDYTRQDKEIESRYAALEKETNQLNILFVLIIMGFGMSVVIFVFFNKRWRKRNRRYLSKLKSVLDLCQKITAAVPACAQSMDEVVDAVLLTIRDDFEHLFQTVDMKISVSGENIGGQEGNFTSFKLLSPGEKVPVGVLLLALSRPLGKEEKEMLRLILPYLAWTIANGLNLVTLDDERKRLEKEQYVHEQHLAEYKRQNIIKKACLSIVAGILPYIDRVVNEVAKLKSAEYARKPEVKKEKLRYITELIEKINEYNDILAMWIKMRQGALNLNIETFDLDDLFAVIRKGKRAFDVKHQELVVEPTALSVKADKALTLFMINTLAENARKYTQNGGRIEVNAAEGDTYVEVSVTDNGPGLSEEDVHRILHEKVYDSGNIGLDTAVDVQALKKQKGHGFGLMNCRGIIEKYRKTNALFDVCTFAVESTPGRGSRFYFRLPKGVRKILSVVIFLGVLLGGTACSGEKPLVDPGESADVFRRDSLLSRANDYANCVYSCNVEGYYADALLYADSAFYYLNCDYAEHSGRGSTPLLKLFDEETVAEEVWFAQGFDTDYYILLDIRNEVAVAALALKDFRLYNYNNNAYMSLYKQLSKDRTLEEYCVQMQQSASNKIVALVMFLLLVVVCLIGYYWLYLRHRLHYRYNIEQTFSINEAIFSASRPADFPGDDIAFRNLLLKRLYVEMNELLPLSDMALAIYDEERNALHYTFRSTDSDRGELRDKLQKTFEKRTSCWHDKTGWSVLPLCMETGGKAHCTGVLALKTIGQDTREEDKLLVELIAGNLAVMLYNIVVRVKRKDHDIELAQDEARKVRHEENFLHVQNLVLDNCLSTIKHETIYYPNRIKTIVERMNHSEDGDAEEESMQLQTMDELVNYYRDIFALLAQCASRQAEEVTFHRTDVKVSTLTEHALKYMRRLMRKSAAEITLEVAGETDMTVKGDEILLCFLLEKLLDEAVKHQENGTLRLAVGRQDNFARFDFIDMRRSYAVGELNELFYPDKKRMRLDDANNLTGTEYLVCKQIIREHDEYSGWRGCRINAEPFGEKGFKVWFTIPLSFGKQETGNIIGYGKV